MAVLIDQYAGAEISKNLYPHWRGGYYYAVRPKGDPAAPLGLLYASRWSNPEKAADFASDLCHGVEPSDICMCAMWLEDGKRPTVQTDPLDHLTGKQAWLTEEGSVVIDVQGDTVLVTESLDQSNDRQMEQEVFGSVSRPANRARRSSSFCIITTLPDFAMLDDSNF